MNMRLLVIGVMLVLSGCFKDELDPATLTNNPFDRDYQGPAVFHSPSTYLATIFIPTVGNVVRQVVEFRVRTDLFLSDAAFSVQVNDPALGMVTLLGQSSVGTDRFLYYRPAQPGIQVCLDLQLANNLNAAGAERICVTL
jgi:hypothetical protein